MWFEWDFIGLMVFCTSSFLRLLEKHNTLQLPMSLLFLCFTGILGNLEIRKVTDHQTAETFKLGVAIKRSMVKPHASDIRMTYEYIRVTYEYIQVTYGWHTSTCEWHTDDILVHTSDIRITYKCTQMIYELIGMPCECIRVTYEWHTSVQKWFTNS